MESGMDAEYAPGMVSAEGQVFFERATLH